MGRYSCKNNNNITQNDKVIEIITTDSNEKKEERTIIFSNKNGFRSVNKNSREFALEVEYEEINNVSVSQYVENNLVNLSLIEQYIFIMNSDALKMILKDCLPSFNMEVMKGQISMDCTQYFQLDTNKYQHLSQVEKKVPEKKEENHFNKKEYDKLCKSKWIDELKFNNCSPIDLHNKEKKENIESE